jgi:hypothetical protein
MSATVRTILRDVLAGVVVVLTQLQQGTPWLRSLIQGALATAVMLGAEVFTPLNAVVGPGKTATVTPGPAKP